MKGSIKAMNAKNKSRGFTLVELIAVVAIISMIAVYITIEINRSSDDAKIGIATAFLTSNVPAAISSYRARHLGSCRDIDDEVGDAEELPDAVNGDTASEEKLRLMARGLAAETPWDDFWTAAYDDDARTITIDFPLFGENEEEVAADILANLEGKSQIVSAEEGEGGLTVVYSCS